MVLAQRYDKEAGVARWATANQVNPSLSVLSSEPGSALHRNTCKTQDVVCHNALWLRTLARAILHSYGAGAG